MGGSSLKAESDADESLHPPPPLPTLTESEMEPNPDQLLPPDLPPPEIPFHNNDNDNDEEGSSARCVNEIDFLRNFISHHLFERLFMSHQFCPKLKFSKNCNFFKLNHMDCGRQL